METIVANNVIDRVFNEPTHFERCNVKYCAFNAKCTFDRCNIIECINTENCECVKSNIIDDDEYNRADPASIEVSSTEVIK